MHFTSGCTIAVVQVSLVKPTTIVVHTYLFLFLVLRLSHQRRCHRSTDCFNRCLFFFLLLRNEESVYRMNFMYLTIATFAQYHVLARRACQQSPVISAFQAPLNILHLYLVSLSREPQVVHFSTSACSAPNINREHQ